MNFYQHSTEKLSFQIRNGQIRQDDRLMEPDTAVNLFDKIIKKLRKNKKQKKNDKKTLELEKETLELEFEFFKLLDRFKFSDSFLI